MFVYVDRPQLFTFFRRPTQAAIVIGQEAGCYVTGGHDSPRDGNVTPEILLGRKYFIVRAIADSEVGSDPQMSIAASDSKADGERNRCTETYRRRVLRHRYRQNPRLDERRSALNGRTPVRPVPITVSPRNIADASREG